MHKNSIRKIICSSINRSNFFAISQPFALLYFVYYTALSLHLLVVFITAMKLNCNIKLLKMAVYSITRSALPVSPANTFSTETVLDRDNLVPRAFFFHVGWVREDQTPTCVTLHAHLPLCSSITPRVSGLYIMLSVIRINASECKVIFSHYKQCNMYNSVA